jgi:hypothetical protein
MELLSVTTNLVYKNSFFSFIFPKNVKKNVRLCLSGTHWIGGWVGPGTGLDDVRKSKISYSYKDSNSVLLAIQPVASRSTDYGVTVPCYIFYND